MASTIKFLAIASVFAISACSGTTGFRNVDSGQVLVQQCLIETGTPGGYSSQSGVGTPVVKPVEQYGGTRQGAGTVNACIRHKVSEGAEVPKRSWRKPRTYTYGVPAGARIAGTPAKSNRRAPQSNLLCPKHAGTIYGGTMYCIGNQ